MLCSMHEQRKVSELVSRRTSPNLRFKRDFLSIYLRAQAHFNVNLANYSVRLLCVSSHMTATRFQGSQHTETDRGWQLGCDLTWPP